MPKWMHDRAEHILAKNPNMPKSQAFAIATQQMHAMDKGPKDYGTSEGKAKAKEKYKTPKDDKKTANPGGLTSEKVAMMSSFVNELTCIIKEANVTPTTPTPTPANGGVGNYLKNTMNRGWNAGGLQGKILNVGTTAYFGRDAFKAEDPTGEGRSRPERISGLVGSVAGGLLGQGMGEDAGYNLIKKIDPTDKFKTVALRNANLANNVAGAKAVQGGIKSMGLLNRAKSLGLRGIPFTLGMGLGTVGTVLGDTLFRAPFMPFRKKPEATTAPQGTPQLVGQPTMT